MAWLTPERDNPRSAATPIQSRSLQEQFQMFNFRQVGLAQGTNGLQTKAAEAWTSSRIRLHTGNAMCVDGALYLTSGGKTSQAILSAVDATSGKILWQERSIQKATFVWADRKLITLSEDGALMLANPSPSGFQVRVKADLLTNVAWTPPVLVGTKLYIRDRKSIMAVDLG